MADRKERRQTVQSILMFTQFGFSLVTPILLCLLLCWWLTDRFGLGSWIYIPGFVIGFGSAATTAIGFYRSVERREKDKPDKKRVSYNRHI